MTSTAERVESDLAVQPGAEELHQLHELQSGLAAGAPKPLVFEGGREVSLAPSAARALRLAVEYLARNLAVVIEPYSSQLTTQRAADLLKVSRPYLVNLLNHGVIPSEKTEGGHRRVRLADVLAYQEQMRSSAASTAPKELSSEEIEEIAGAGAGAGASASGGESNR